MRCGAPAENAVEVGTDRIFGPLADLVTSDAILVIPFAGLGIADQIGPARARQEACAEKRQDARHRYRAAL